MNAKPKILTVVGTRPQLIKAAPVSRALAASGAFFEVLVDTGQHYDPEMSGVFYEELGLRQPAHSLGISGGSHGDMTGRMLVAIDPVLTEEAPVAVIVYGDTNSTLAGVLAAAKLGIPVVHVEAGLRSFDRAMAEEINRITADHISATLFCPTHTAVKNLKAEGIVDGVHHVGDVMYDAVLMAAEQAQSQSRILEKLNLKDKSYAVVTLHRAENTDDAARLSLLVRYLKERCKDHPLVMPLHPRTREALKETAIDLGEIQTCPPLGYLDMTRLVRGAAAVYTDSGGLQKECYFHLVPCVTLRQGTEWTETIEAGWNRLWENEVYMERRDIDDYGDGHAARRIVEILVETYA